MRVNNVLYGSFFLIVLVCGNEVSKTGNPKVIEQDYGSAEIYTILNDPNFDIENMTVRIEFNGEVHKTHLRPVVGHETDVKLGVIPKKKIIGGTTSQPGAIPYIVALYGHTKLFCGGSIFNKDYVLTAAHCFHDEKNQKLSDQVIQKLSAVAGDHSASTKDPNEQKRKIINLIIHPKYDAKESTFDVALLKVDQPFVYDHYVQPIPIGYPPVKPAGEVWVSGWGYTQVRPVELVPIDRYYIPDKLQTTNINYISNSACKQMYSSTRSAQRMVDSGVLFCAGVPDGSKDACNGDSGGPLVCLNRDPNFKGSKTQKWLCGVIATGYGCGLPNKPGFFTKLSNTEVKDWINQVAGWADRPTRPY